MHLLHAWVAHVVTKVSVRVMSVGTAMVFTKTDVPCLEKIVYQLSPNKANKSCPNGFWIQLAQIMLLCSSACCCQWHWIHCQTGYVDMHVKIWKVFTVYVASDRQIVYAGHLIPALKGPELQAFRDFLRSQAELPDSNL